MKVYQLMAPQELEAAWKARRQRDLWDMGDTLAKIKEHFCFEVPGGGSGLRGAEDRRGTGVNERGPAGR